MVSRIQSCQSWCRQRNSREEKHIGGIRAFILNYGAIFGPIFWLLAGTLQMDRGLTLLVFHILRVGARRLRLVITHIGSLNSKGIPSRSPGCEQRATLGRAGRCCQPWAGGCNLFRDCLHSPTESFRLRSAGKLFAGEGPNAYGPKKGLKKRAIREKSRSFSAYAFDDQLIDLATP